MSDKNETSLLRMDAKLNAVEDYKTEGKAIVLTDSIYGQGVMKMLLGDKQAPNEPGVKVLAKSQVTVLSDPRYAVRETVALSEDDYPAVEYDQTALMFHATPDSPMETLGVWEKRFEGEERTNTNALKEWGNQTQEYILATAVKHRDLVAGPFVCGCGGGEGCGYENPEPTTH